MKKKKTIIGTLCLLLLSICFSCKQSPEDKLRNAFENEVLKDMHDPSSYEFVSIQFLEPYTGLDKLKNDHKNYIEESNIEALELYYDMLLPRIERYKSTLASGDLYTEGHLDYSRNELQKTTKEAESIKSEIETHKAVLDDLSRKIENKDKIDEIIFLKASIKIRAKNALGALVLSEYLIQYDEDYNVLGISEI